MSIKDCLVGIFIYLGGFLFLFAIDYSTCSTLSAYYPFLLSRNHYFIIKNKKMQKLIGEDFHAHASKNTRTLPEDRNKMALTGFISYIILAITLIGYVIYGLWGGIMSFINAQYLQMIMLSLAKFFVLALVIKIIIDFIFSFDYFLGKMINKKKL